MVSYTFKAAVAGLALAGSGVAKVDKVTAIGDKMFYANGTQFFMKGIAYQAEFDGKTRNGKKYIDSLADPEACKRDLPIIAEAGSNTIRTYQIDPDADHTECLKLMSQYGIHGIYDIGEPDIAVNRDDPKYNVAMLKRSQKVIDALGKHETTLGFISGNEVSNAKNNTQASAFVKALNRDAKAYAKAQGMDVMIGYAANDDKDIRIQISQYFNCGPQDEAIDFWGYNIYSWCGKSNLEDSGYTKQVEFFKNYSVPVFFAEYGCNLPDGAEGRPWTDTAALYEDEMTKKFSGGLAYMYHQEANDYGVVKISNGKATKMKNYEPFKKAQLAAKPKGIDGKSYKSDLKPQECPKVDANWKASSVLPPKPDEELCKCAAAASTCQPSDKLQTKDYGELFNYICSVKGKNYCAGIKADAEKGLYGSYSMCDAKEQLAYVLGVYYKDLGTAASCDFDGKAKVSKASAESSCSSKLEVAEKNNAHVATATAAASTSGSGSSDDDEGVAPSNSAVMAVYAAIAAGVGATLAFL